MTSTAQLLSDSFGRVREVVHEAVEGLTAEQLTYRPDAQANSIAWLVWHLTRVQDDHIADAAGTEQVWSRGNWAQEFDLPFTEGATGYGSSSRDVAAVAGIPPKLFLDYHDAVHEQTVRFVQGLTDSDLDRVVDEAWDPPVTLAVRLISVVSDDLQHAGQAAYVRGLIERSH